MQHYSKILNGLSQYIENEIAVPLNGSLKAWGVRIAAGVLRERADKMLQLLMQHPVARAFELADGEMVDEELVFRMALEAARKGAATVDIPMLGPVTFSEKDVEALHRYIIGG